MTELTNITKAIISVMKTVKGIEKDSTVGTGQNSYKGVGDQQVKQIIGRAMQENGLVIVPTGIEESTQLSEWNETSSYQGKDYTKRKQSVFTKVKTKYLLIHESGESIELTGYGHGVDTQDKAAGKATTYALKYALLYTFLVPTGDIDDTDSTHSSDIQTAQETYSAPTSVQKPQESSQTSGSEKQLNPNGRVRNNTGAQCPSCHAPAGFNHGTSCKAVMQGVVQ